MNTINNEHEKEKDTKIELESAQHDKISAAEKQSGKEEGEDESQFIETEVPNQFVEEDDEEENQFAETEVANQFAVEDDEEENQFAETEVVNQFAVEDDEEENQFAETEVANQFVDDEDDYDNYNNNDHSNNGYKYVHAVIQERTQPIISEVAVLTRPQWLQLYLVAVIFCNLYLIFLDGHFDIGFWKNWTTELATTGFANYHGDYPPLWSDWLWVVSKFYVYLQQPIENTILFKYVTQIPITIYHLLLTYIIYRVVNNTSKSDLHFHAALILTVFNPAILFNGPIWGQIDIAPVVPLIAAILAGTSSRYQAFMIPLYLLSLLTKFQMIGFAPVFGILFFRNIKSHIIGILLCIPTFLIAFLPAILAHNFVQAFSLPYIGSLHMFSAATMGASNLWILLTGNLAPDSTILFGFTPNTLLGKLFTVRTFGMISFSIICLFVFIKGVKPLAMKKFAQNQNVLTSDMLFYAVICLVTFFTLLPGMHERYLLPAVIVALAYYASAPTKIFYPITLTFISAFNLTMSHGIHTNSIWPSLSWIMLAVFFYGLGEFIFGKSWLAFIRHSVQKIASIKWLFVWVFLITVSSTTYILYERLKINKINLSEHEMFLTTIQPSYAAQDYGVLQHNLNVSGSALTLGGKRYSDGFGTHANSTINFTLPENAKEFSFIGGLDDEVESADVILSVWGDDKLLWQSPILYRSIKNAPVVSVNVDGIKQLSLRANALGSISGDHVDWVNPIIRLKP